MRRLADRPRQFQRFLYPNAGVSYVCCFRLPVYYIVRLMRADIPMNLPLPMDPPAVILRHLTRA